MNITTISCKRIRNLGNYESRTLEMSAEISITDDVNEATKRLIELVENNLFEKEKDENNASYQEYQETLKKNDGVPF